MTINLLDRRNRDTDLATLTSRHNANLSLSLSLFSHVVRASSSTFLLNKTYGVRHYILRTNNVNYVVLIVARIDSLSTEYF